MMNTDKSLNLHLRKGSTKADLMREEQRKIEEEKKQVEIKK